MPLSKRLYRLIDLQRAGGLSWRTDLFAVRDQVPLDYLYPSQIKRVLKKAHEELEEKGFLSGVKYEGNEGNAGMVYRISQTFARRQKALELSGTPQELFAIERLMREGVRGDTARDLVVSNGAEKCLRYAEALDNQEGIRNRASFLVSAIRKSYAFAEPPEPVEEPLGYSLVADSSQERETKLYDEDPSPALPPDPAAEKLWGRVLEHAEEEIDASSLRVWFEAVTAVAIGPDYLTISVPNPFAREYVETRFKETLESALRQELAQDAALRVVVGAGGEHKKE